MHRRQFTRLTTSLVAGSALSPVLWPTLSHAQGGPIEGVNYVKLSQRQPTQDPKKVEVVEFFWYGCPHCHSFEPLLDAWARKLPADVNFRRLPVAFREVPFVLHQKLYFAIETLGLIDTLHRKVFNAIHVERLTLNTPEAIGDFVEKNGVDKAKFLDVMNSFSVATKAKQAASLSAGYKIDGTPALGINGSYFTSGSMAGGNDRALAVADYLIAQARKGA
jgi:thiol:disulfide interchange protein DsbA